MSASDHRVKELEATLNDMLNHIRPQGHPDWELHTCLVTSDQVAQWQRVAQSHDAADRTTEK